MKAPRQWSNTWLKQDTKRLDLVNCFYVCYDSRRQKTKIENFLT